MQNGKGLRWTKQEHSRSEKFPSIVGPTTNHLQHAKSSALLTKITKPLMVCFLSLAITALPGCPLFGYLFSSPSSDVLPTPALFSTCGQIISHFTPLMSRSSFLTPFNLPSLRSCWVHSRWPDQQHGATLRLSVNKRKRSKSNSVYRVSLRKHKNPLSIFL